MRRKDKLVTDVKTLHAVINQAQVCRLAMVDDTTPYVVPLSFGFDGTYLYFHSAKEGRKIDLLQKNNRVCVEFEAESELITKGQTPCNWSFRYCSVICDGTAEFVADPQEKNAALNQIIRHYKPEWEFYSFTEQELASIAILKIRIAEMTGKMSGRKS